MRAMEPRRERLAAASQFASLVLAAATVRVLLSTRFFGWEESDYGNLMMVREVLDSRFTWFRVEHMPGWYSAAALLRLLLPDARVSALALTLPISALTVGLGAYCARSVAGPGAGWLAGAWLALQPESALYGASTLHQPLAAGLVTASMALLLLARPGPAAAAAGLATLTRMEALFAALPPALWAMLRDLGLRGRGLLLPAAALLGCLAGWQGYVSLVHGEGLFFVGPVGVNLAPDPEGAARVQWIPWISEGLRTAAALLLWVLPRKVSWLWMLLAACGAAAALRGLGWAGSRSALAFLLGTLGYWLGTGFLFQHHPTHNLYWVWLLPTLPPLAVMAALGWSRLDRRLAPLPRPARLLVLVAVVVAPLPVFRAEAAYQIHRAELWYRPQLDLCRWLEETVPRDHAVLVASIPEVLLQREAPRMRVLSWWKLPEGVRDASRDAFGAWLAQEQVDYVVWFREDWTDAPAIAPWLADGTDAQAGPLTLRFADREDGYGWILYAAQRDGEAAPQLPPRFGSGIRGRGWD
jgi:hypothetical protein